MMQYRPLGWTTNEFVSANCLLSKHCTRENTLLLRRNIFSFAFGGQFDFHESDLQNGNKCIASLARLTRMDRGDAMFYKQSSKRAIIKTLFEILFGSL